MRRGPLYMTAAGLMFTAMVSMVKIVRSELGAFDVVFWRGFIAIPVALAFAWRAGLRISNLRLFVVRVLFGFGAMIGFFHAARGLTVANLSLIHKLQPIFVTVVAPIALGRAERAGAFIWTLLVCGLAGCALIIAPDMAVGSTYGVIALGAAMASAFAHVCVRGLIRTDDPRVIVLWFQTAAMILAASYLAIATGELPELPSSELWPYVIGIGVTATAGQLLMTRAYSEDRAAVVAAASYTTPIWGVTADLMIFAAVPDGYTIIGGSIILACGLLLIFRRDRPAGVVTPDDA